METVASIGSLIFLTALIVINILYVVSLVVLVSTPVAGGFDIIAIGTIIALLFLMPFAAAFWESIIPIIILVIHFVVGIVVAALHHGMVIDNFYNNLTNVTKICGDVEVMYRVGFEDGNIYITFIKVQHMGRELIHWKGNERYGYSSYGNYPPFTEETKFKLINYLPLSNFTRSYAFVILPRCVTIGKNIYNKTILIDIEVD